MLLKSIFSTSILLCFLPLFISCSPRADYKRTINRQILSVDFATDIEINCEQKKSRAVISGSPANTMDGIEEVSQNWEEIDKLFEHATKELFANYKKEFADKPFMIKEVKRQAFIYQKAVEAEYFKACNKSYQKE